MNMTGEKKRSTVSCSVLGMLSVWLLALNAGAADGAPDLESFTYERLFNRAGALVAPRTEVEKSVTTEGDLKVTGGELVKEDGDAGLTVIPAGEEAVLTWTEEPSSFVLPESVPPYATVWALSFTLEAPVPIQYRVHALVDGRFNRLGKWQEVSPGEQEAFSRNVFKAQGRLFEKVKSFGGIKLEVRGDAIGGSRVQVRDMRVTTDYRTGFFRQTFELPQETLWSAVADIGNRTVVHINGREVQDTSIILPRPVKRGGEMYESKRVSVLPYLQPGRNIIALSSDRHAYFRASAVTVSGEKVLLDSGAGWRYATDAPENWVQLDFNDNAWGVVREPTVSAWEMIQKGMSDVAESYPLTSIYFHFRKRGDMPAYDGLLRLENPYDRKLFYTSGDPILVDIEIPGGLAEPAISWQILKYSEDEHYVPVGSGTVPSFQKQGDSLRGRVEHPALEGGVYLLAAELRAGGKLLEERVPEPFVVTHRVDMKPVPGDTFEQGMELSLEKTIDFTDPASPFEWMEIDAKGARPQGKWDESFHRVLDTALIVERNGLKYRETRGNFAAQFSYKIDAFDHPGDWYLMVLHFPDDAERRIGVACSTQARMDYLASLNMDSAHCVKCGPSVVTGGKYPVSGKMRTFKWLYRPNPGSHTVNIISLMKKHAAAAAKVDIFHVAGNLPELALPEGVFREGRRFGILTERTTTFTTYAGYYAYFGIEEKLSRGAGRGSPNAVREACKRLFLQLDAAQHWAEYMRFAGQNIHVMGCFMYQDRNTCPQFLTGSPRLHPNSRDVAARVFSENGVGFYGSVEFGGAMVQRRSRPPVREQYLIGRDGEMSGTFNFMHPEIEQDSLMLAEQLSTEFSDQASFLGINWLTWFDGMWYWGPSYRYGSGQTDPLGLGYGDLTIRRFEQETGVDVPGAHEDPDRHEKRYAFLTSGEMRPRWITWRAEHMHRFFEKMLTAVRAVRPDLECMVNLGMGPYHTREWKEADVPSGTYLKEWGWDTQLFGTRSGVGMMPWQFGNAWNFKDPMGWQANHDPGFYRPFTKLERRRTTFRYGWLELERFTAAFEDREGWPRPYQQTVMMQQRPEMAMEPFTQAVIGMDPELISFGFTDAVPFVGNEDVQRRFARVFLRLPAADFEPVLDTGFRSNLAIRVLHREHRTYVAVMNPGHWPVSGTIDLRNAAQVKDIVNGNAQVSGPIRVELEPFGFAGYVIDAPDAEVTGFRVQPLSKSDRAHLDGIVARANKALSTEGMAEFLGEQDFGILKAGTEQAEALLGEGQYAAAWNTLTQADYWFVLDERTANAKYADNVGKRELVAVCAVEPPRIDGKLDDDVWKTCIPVTRFVKPDRELSEFESWVYAAWSEGTLYLAFDYRDPNPDEILGVEDTGKETEFWGQQHDYADFVIKPTAKQYYQFALNPKNFRFDQACMVGGSRDYGYAPKWQSAAVITDTGWTVEVAVDTQDAFGKTISEGDVWEANFHRFFRNDASRLSSWVWNPGNFHSTEHLGEIRFVRANLLENPSAERVRDELPVGWGQTHVQQGNYEFSVSETEAHSGKRAARLTYLHDKKGPMSSIVVGSGNGVPVAANRIYDFSFWMKTDSPAAKILVLLSDGAGKSTLEQTSFDRQVPRGDGWYKYEGFFETGAAIERAKLCFRFVKAYGSSTGIVPGMTLTLDDVLIHERQE